MKIIEAAPTSKKKRWALVEVVEKSREVDVAAMRAARKETEQGGTDAVAEGVTDTATPEASE